MVEVKDAERGHICCSEPRSKIRQHSPAFPRRGPPTARSGYVHLEGLHTGLSLDAVSAGTKGKHMSQGFKMQAP